MESQTASERPFDHYTMKHRSVAWISQNVFDNFVYTVRHGLIKGMKCRGGLGWLPEFLTGSSRTMEQSFWMSQNLKNLVLVLPLPSSIRNTTLVEPGGKAVPAGGDCTTFNTALQASVA